MNLFEAYFENQVIGDARLLTTEDGSSFSYADAERCTMQLAHVLTNLGLEAGDRVTVQVEKSPQNLWLFLAVLRAGLVYHPLNTAYTEDELAFFLRDAQPSLVVCDAGNYVTMRSIADGAGVEHVLTLNADGSGSLTDLAGGAPCDFQTVARNNSDVAALVYSSGTTGTPKGIMLTHGNLIANASTLVEHWGFSSDDCLLHALPIFHVHGLFVALGCVFMSGASMYWLRAFNVPSVIERLPGCTSMMGVPTYYTRLLDSEAFTRDSVAHMRLFVSGSAPLLADTFAAFERQTGHSILERYGMTETGMITSNPLDGPRKMGTVGPALPGVSVRITSDSGEVLPVGEVGGIEVKGPNVFVGYWNLPKKTAEDFTEDGYFKTGDQGVFDEDGYVSIVGRSKDMIITGGLNVYPKELELLIDELPGVLESAVIGLPHDDFGEQVAAVVVPDKGYEIDEAQVRDAVRARAAAFKVPKRVYFSDELPRNAMGKVQKARLRSIYSA
jgi:malonyl-CoA/methylmalonyl-CoA synthetase